MPKRVPPLSAKALAAVRPSTSPIELVDGYVPGLRVRILPNGKRAWSLNIRDSKGVRRRFDVGAGHGLAEARRRAEELRRAVRDGADPTSERRAGRQRAHAARQGLGTLDALLDTYFLKGPGARLRGCAKCKRLLQTVFAKALGRPVLHIQRSELQLIADDWQSQATASLAIRLLRPCLKWAEKRGLVAAGIHQLEPPGTVRTRDRVLSAEELKAVWPHLRLTHGNVVKWLLWTGCRLNEAAGMSWGEIDGDKWTLPAARTKNGRQRLIPLPQEALALLGRIGRGQPHDLVFPSKRGGMLSNWDRETKRLHVLSGTTGWHRHDLRRMVATILGDLGVAPHVVSVVLGHAHIAEGATAVYARSRYQTEHREALQVIAREIERIVAPGDTVVRIAAYR
jgi:integrase